MTPEEVAAEVADLPPLPSVVMAEVARVLTVKDRKDAA